MEKQYCFANRNNIISFNTRQHIRISSKLTITSMCTQYANNNVVATKSSIKREQEHSTFRMFIIRLVQYYKIARPNTRQAIRIQLVLCEDALCVKKTVVV